MEINDHLNLRYASKDHLLTVINYLSEQESNVQHLRVEDSEFDIDVLMSLAHKYNQNLKSLVLINCNLDRSDLIHFKRFKNLLRLYIPDFEDDDLREIREFVNENWINNSEEWITFSNASTDVGEIAENIDIDMEASFNIEHLDNWQDDSRYQEYYPDFI